MVGVVAGLDVVGEGVGVVGDGEGVVGLGVVMAGLVVAGVVLVFEEADFEPPLEHAVGSRVAAASRVRAVSSRGRGRRPSRMPGSAMASTLAGRVPERQPVGPSDAGFDKFGSGRAAAPPADEAAYEACNAGAATNSTARIRSSRTGEAGASITSSAPVRAPSRSR